MFWWHNTSTTIYIRTLKIGTGLEDHGMTDREAYLIQMFQVLVIESYPLVKFEEKNSFSFTMGRGASLNSVRHNAYKATEQIIQAAPPIPLFSLSGV